MERRVINQHKLIFQVNTKLVEQGKDLIKNLKELSMLLNDGVDFESKECQSDFYKLYRYSTTGFVFDNELINRLIKKFNLNKSLFIDLENQSLAQ